MVFFQPCLLPGMVRLRWFPIFCAMVHGKVSLEEFYCSLRFRQMKVTRIVWLPLQLVTAVVGSVFFLARSRMNSESHSMHSVWTSCRIEQPCIVWPCLAVLKKAASCPASEESTFFRSSHSFCVWDVFPRISRSNPLDKHWRFYGAKGNQESRLYPSTIRWWDHSESRWFTATAKLLVSIADVGSSSPPSSRKPAGSIQKWGLLRPLLLSMPLFVCFFGAYADVNQGLWLKATSETLH